MATYDLAAIRGTVRLRGNYESSIKYTDTYINTEIQSAAAEWYELIADTHEGWWTKDGTVSTTGAQQFVALPADCWRVSGIDLLSGSDYLTLDQITIADRNRFGTSNAQPRAYRLSSRGAELYPTPDTTYTIRITYTPTYTQLSDGVFVDYHNDWHDYIIVGALKRLAERMKSPMAAEHGAELARVKQRIVEGASQRKSAEPEYLNLRERYGMYEEWY